MANPHHTRASTVAVYWHCLQRSVYVGAELNRSHLVFVPDAWNRLTLSLRGPSLRLYLLGWIGLITRRLRCSIREMPTRPRIFVSASHGSQLMRSPLSKMVFWLLLAWSDPLTLINCLCERRFISLNTKRISANKMNSVIFSCLTQLVTLQLNQIKSKEPPPVKFSLCKFFLLFLSQLLLDLFHCIACFGHWVLWSNLTEGGCPRGVMVKAMDCGIVIREFVLQSRYYVHFRANTLGKGMNPLILPAMG